MEDGARLGAILGIWAHPDDEAYLMGGVMALAADAGQHVACVTATLGDAGETADAQRWPREDLRRIREEELARALGLLGVSDHSCLYLPDGRLAELDPEGPVGDLVAVIDRVRPDTVITFGPDGMTGHLDHKTVSNWTVTALERVSIQPRLLFATKTDTWGDDFHDLNSQVFPPGLPPRISADAAWSLPLDELTLERKVQALEAHASQTSGLIATFGRARYAEWVRLEAFQPV